jgi:hypothetical protein
MVTKDKFEIVTNVAGQVINLLHRQRYHSSDSVTPRAADAELAKLNGEVKAAYGAEPPGWGDFYMRANTFLDLSSRHRGQSEWIPRLDEIYSQLEMKKDQLATDALQRQHERIQVEEKARERGLIFSPRS